MKTTTTFNEKSSFTADGVAYRRIFTDIPFAKEIWEILETVQGKPSEEELKRMQNRGMLSFFEARYLITDRELKKSRAKQVLELAPGLSSRGMVMTQFPDITYVELDLPEKMTSKKKVVDELTKRNLIKISPNLFLENGNAVNKEDFVRATSHFTPNKPVAVICEGLLRYISFEDKETLAKQIHALIKRTGGVWITPDIEFQSDVNATPARAAHYATAAKISGFDVQPNIFRDEAHALSFFENLGFSIEKYPLTEAINLLVSPKKVGLTEEEVNSPLKNRWTYVMRAK